MLNIYTSREIIRKQVPAWAFHIFNWTFISFIQSVLLFLIAAPVYVVLLTTQFEPDFSGADMAYVLFELGLIGIEIIADQQQWGKKHRGSGCESRTRAG